MISATLLLLNHEHHDLHHKLFLFLFLQFGISPFLAQPMQLLQPPFEQRLSCNELRRTPSSAQQTPVGHNSWLLQRIAYAKKLTTFPKLTTPM
ncbi:hypothetical protein Hanom_Chr09g00820521 [Helianthus anomalus]